MRFKNVIVHLKLLHFWSGDEGEKVRRQKKTRWLAAFPTEFFQYFRGSIDTFELSKIRQQPYFLRLKIVKCLVRRLSALKRLY